MSMPDMKWCHVDGFEIPPPPSSAGEKDSGPKRYVKWEELRQEDRDQLLAFVESDGKIDGGKLAENHGLEEWPKAESALRAYYGELVRRYEGPLARAVEANEMKKLLDKLAVVLGMGLSLQKGRAAVAATRAERPGWDLVGQDLQIPQIPSIGFSKDDLAEALNAVGQQCQHRSPKKAVVHYGSDDWCWLKLPYEVRCAIMAECGANPDLRVHLDRCFNYHDSLRRDGELPRTTAVDVVAFRTFMLGLTEVMLLGEQPGWVSTNDTRGIVRRLSTGDLETFQKIHRDCTVAFARAEIQEQMASVAKTNEEKKC